MSLREVITKASSTIPTFPDANSDYPIVLNRDPIIAQLKPEADRLQAESPVKKVTGWEIAQTDRELIELGINFFKTLRRKLKDTNSFGKVEFSEMIASHLEKIGEKVGLAVRFNRREEGYACRSIEKLGVLMGRDVKGLVLEGCVSLEAWDLFESIVVSGIVEHSHASILISKLIVKRRSDLIVLCVKHLLDLQTYDMMCILKYFLMLPGDGYKSLFSVREHWERQALLAIDKVSGEGVSGKDRTLAKDAVLLVMLAHDGFLISELCLHYLVASPNLDEVNFAACVSKLNGEEIKAFIRYIGKWLRKYESFPQVVPCPKASSALCLEVCDWIPTLENLVKCLAVVVDEHFSSLVLHNEFDELRPLEGLVSSLAADARVCGTLANLTERLRTERQAYHSDTFGAFTL